MAIRAGLSSPRISTAYSAEVVLLDRDMAKRDRLRTGGRTPEVTQPITFSSRQIGSSAITSASAASTTRVESLRRGPASRARKGLAADEVRLLHRHEPIEGGLEGRVDGPILPEPCQLFLEPHG